MTVQSVLTTEQAQILARYMGWPQWSSLQSLMEGGEEAAFFQEIATSLSRCIADMPTSCHQQRVDVAPGFPLWRHTCLLCVGILAFWPFGL